MRRLSLTFGLSLVAGLVTGCLKDNPQFDQTDGGFATVWPIPGRLEAEFFRPGGQQVGYYDSTPGNHFADEPEPFRVDEDVDVSAATDEGQRGWVVGGVAIGEWLSFDVNVREARAYTLVIRAASEQTDTKTLHIDVDGRDVTGPVRFNTGGAGWNSHQTFRKDDVKLPAGRHLLQITMEANAFNLNYIELR